MSSPLKTFSAKIETEGKFTFVSIHFSPREEFGERPRFYVSGTINGFDVTGTLGALGKDYFLRLSVAWLKQNKIEPGTKVEVKLMLDESRLNKPVRR